MGICISKNKIKQEEIIIEEEEEEEEEEEKEIKIKEIKIKEKIKEDKKVEDYLINYQLKKQHDHKESLEAIEAIKLYLTNLDLNADILLAIQQKKRCIEVISNNDKYQSITTKKNYYVTKWHLDQLFDFYRSYLAEHYKQVYLEYRPTYTLFNEERYVYFAIW
jgi:hypothetical protein